jgi:PhnB protein
MHIQPYLFFDGRADEAIACYQDAIGARVLMRMTFGEGPQGEQGCADGPAPPADKVMHACLQIGDTQVMLSDGFAAGSPQFKGISLSLSTSSDADAERCFAALAEGGKVVQPMEATFFASRFGMLEDRFGVSWMVLNPLPMPG